MNENKTNINWYPGHMLKTKKQIIEDLKLIDVVVELLDARIPKSSRNPDIQKIVQDKKRIVLLNKSDLAEDRETKKWIEYYKNKRNLKSNRKICRRRNSKSSIKRQSKEKYKSCNTWNTKCRKVIINKQAMQ